jgi:hypothetical protein
MKVAHTPVADADIQSFSNNEKDPVQLEAAKKIS